VRCCGQTGWHAQPRGLPDVPDRGLALKSNPSKSNACWGLAFLLLTQGRTEERFVQLRLAVALDPMSPVMHRLEGAFPAGACRLEQTRLAFSSWLRVSW